MSFFSMDFRKKLPDSMAAWKQYIQTFCVSAVVLLSLVVYFVIGLFNSYALFCLLFCLVLALYFFGMLMYKSKTGKIGIEFRKLLVFNNVISFQYLWLIAFIGLIIGFIQGPKGMGNLKDLVIIAGCALLIFYAPKNAGAYKHVLKLFVGFAIFYAVSVWVQIIFPDVYRFYLSILQNGSDSNIESLKSYYTGFTTHPAYTGYFLVLGIMVFALDIFKKPVRSLIAIAFLMITLFFTGMKMPVFTIFLCVAILAFMQIPASKRKKYLLIFAGCCVAALLLVLLLKDQFDKIPVFRRTFAALEALFSGKDASSGRIPLYRHAVKLFCENPIFGIGWGKYRTTVPGNVTYETMFDVHNIYLQLLCETGIIGFSSFLVPMACFLVKTVKTFCLLLKTNQNDVWTKLIGFSMLCQIYFLVLGLIDNTLYNTCQQLTYFISCSILASYLLQNNQNAQKNRKEA